jgi:hypothetical protein
LWITSSQFTIVAYWERELQKAINILRVGTDSVW